MNENQRAATSAFVSLFSPRCLFVQPLLSEWGEAKDLAAWRLEKESGVGFLKTRGVVVFNLGYAERLQPRHPFGEVLYFQFQPSRFEIILFAQQFAGVV